MKTTTMTIDEQLAYLLKGSAEVIDKKELRRKLEKSQQTGKPLTVKVGFDPTAPDLHLGHTVLLRKMKHFQDLGHRVIFLIGDFTSMIGDPTGRTKTRPPLTQEEIRRNAETYKNQVFKILHSDKTVIDFNSRWLASLSSQDWIRLCAKYTVARMLERDDFSRRMAHNQPVSIHEFLYPLAQAYDSVVLEADCELGGTDQKFNLLVGRDIQREFGQKPQVLLMTPLLEGLDGVRKMSKSLDNHVGIEELPEQMYGKLMSISDELMWRYFELLTDSPHQEISRLKREVETNKRHPMTVKKDLAFRITHDFHSKRAAQEARDHFQRVFQQREEPEKMPSQTYSLAGRASVRVSNLIFSLGMTNSHAEARRLIRQGGVSVNGQKIEDPGYPLEPTDKPSRLRVGKLNFCEVTIVS